MLCRQPNPDRGRSEATKATSKAGTAQEDVSSAFRKATGLQPDPNTSRDEAKQFIFTN